MRSTDALRAKIKMALQENGGASASIVMSNLDLTILLRCDLEDALDALGTSQRVLRTRAILVEALKTCDALTEALTD